MDTTTIARVIARALGVPEEAPELAAQLERDPNLRRRAARALRAWRRSYRRGAPQVDRRRATVRRRKP